MRHKLTLNQKSNAIEILTSGLVAFHHGDARGCLATVRSRTDPRMTYEVAMGTDRRGLWYRCKCQLQQHRPSRMCSHIAAVYVVWQAVLRGADEYGDGDEARTSREEQRA